MYQPVYHRSSIFAGQPSLFRMIPSHYHPFFLQLSFRASSELTVVFSVDSLSLYECVDIISSKTGSMEFFS
jgi:hypothetical protein